MGLVVNSSASVSWNAPPMHNPLALGHSLCGLLLESASTASAVMLNEIAKQGGRKKNTPRFFTLQLPEASLCKFPHKLRAEETPVNQANGRQLESL